jgi:hypothetical protein
VVLFRQGYSEGFDLSLQGQMAGWIHFSTYWFDSKWHAWIHAGRTMISLTLLDPDGRLAAI